MATQLGYKVLWNISIKEPRNTGFPDRMISYFFSLFVKASILRCSGQKLSHFIFSRGAFIYQTSSFDRRLQYVTQYPDDTSIRTLETKTQFLRRPFQFSVNEVFRMKAEHFSFKMKVLAI